MTSENLGFTHRFEPGSGGQETLLLLHGTGGDENDLISLGKALLPDAALLSPRGKVLERGMPRFFRRFAEGVFDVDDLKARTHELADFVNRAAQEYGIDAGKVITVGYSNGANIASSGLLLRPEIFRTAILFHPMVPFTMATLPDLRDVPIFIGAGRNDPICPPEQTDALAEMLKSAGAEVTVAWQNGGHALSREEAAQAAQWLGRLPR